MELLNMIKNSAQKSHIEDHYRKVAKVWMILFISLTAILFIPIGFLSADAFNHYYGYPNYIHGFYFPSFIGWLLCIGIIITALVYWLLYLKMKRDVALLFRLITQSSENDHQVSTLAERLNLKKEVIFRYLNQMIVYGDISGNLEKNNFSLKPFSEWKISSKDLNKLKGMVKIHGEIDLNYASAILQIPRQVLLGKIYEIVGIGTANIALEGDIIKPLTENDTSAVLDALDTIFAQWGDGSFDSTIKA